MEHALTIPFDEDELAATLHYPLMPDKAGDAASGGRWPLVIICHGFIGSRIGVDRLFVKAARQLSSEGYMVLRFDYGGCGESTGNYGAGGIGALVAQTRRVIDYCLGKDCVDPGNVILLGHSLGGAVAVLTAADDKRVKKLILWSPVAYPHNDIARIVGPKVWKRALEHGVADYMGYAFNASFFQELNGFHPLQATKRFSGDVLVVHGSSDDILPTEYCFLYQRAFWLRSEGQCDKEVIVGADHTYSSGDAYAQLIGKTQEWLGGLEQRRSEWNHWTI